MSWCGGPRRVVSTAQVPQTATPQELVAAHQRIVEGGVSAIPGPAMGPNSESEMHTRWLRRLIADGQAQSEMAGSH